LLRELIIHAKPDKPPEHQVQLQPLHQLVLGADALEHLQQHRPKQPLWSNRGHPKIRVKRRKADLAAHSQHGRIFAQNLSLIRFIPSARAYSTVSFISFQPKPRPLRSDRSRIANSPDW
jgi:hypothetical protein